MSKKLSIIILFCGLALTMMPSVVFAADYQCVCRDAKGAFDYFTEGNYTDKSKCEQECKGYCLKTYTGSTSRCETVSAPASPPSAAPSPATAKLINPLGITSLPALIGRVISAILGIVGSLALVMFIWGGFLWMTAHGNPNQLTKGKDTLVWATIGLVIIFLSYTLVNFVIRGLTGTLPAGEGGGAKTGTCVKTEAKVTSCFISTDSKCVGNIIFYPGKEPKDISECQGGG